MIKVWTATLSAPIFAQCVRVAVKRMPNDRSIRGILGALKQPNTPEIESASTSTFLYDNQDVVAWLDQTRGHVVLRMLAILSRSPYSDPGPEREAVYDGSNTPPASSDPPHIAFVVPIKAVFGLSGGGGESSGEE